MNLTVKSESLQSLKLIPSNLQLSNLISFIRHPVNFAMDRFVFVKTQSTNLQKLKTLFEKSQLSNLQFS